MEWWRPNAGRGWGWTGAWGNESYTDPGPGSDWPDWPDEPGSGGPGDPDPTEPPPDPAPRPESPPWGDDAGVFWTTAFDDCSSTGAAEAELTRLTKHDKTSWAIRDGKKVLYVGIGSEKDSRALLEKLAKDEDEQTRGRALFRLALL